LRVILIVSDVIAVGLLILFLNLYVAYPVNPSNKPEFDSELIYDVHFVEKEVDIGRVLHAMVLIILQIVEEQKQRSDDFRNEEES
jgi:hypothetical protein